MSEYDLPLKEECGTCFGHGQVKVFIKAISLSRDYWHTFDCDKCDCTGYIELEELELEE